MKTISEIEDFYGYIIGLQLEQSQDEIIGSKLYATFEYGGNVKTWEVPDEELFKLLASRLCDMAWERKNTDAYGISKLWIKKGPKGWEVDLP